jgi:hypothetical protein
VQRAHHAIVAPWSKWLGRIRPHAVDAGLAVVVAVAVTIAISVAREPGARPPDTLAYVLGVTIGAFVLARQRWPVGVLVASFVTLQVYYFANYLGILPAVPLAIALYTAAAAGYLRWSLAVAAWYWVILLLFAAFGVLGSPVPALNELVRDGSLLAAVLLLGDAVAAHRALMAEASEWLRRAEEDRKREAQELSAARVIQQQLVPKELPDLPGWRVAAYYQPARAVGGDFYDFLELLDGQVALVTGDVTGKGIPAALVMATTHSILRGDAPGLVSPRAMLERGNDRLYPDIPAHMFVTCLYAVLDPVSGRLRKRGAQPSLHGDGGRSHRASRDRNAARCHARHDLRGERSLPRSRPQHPAPQRRPRRGARCSRRDVRLSTPPKGRREQQRRRAHNRRVPHRAERVRRERMGAGGRHHPRDARVHDVAVLDGDSVRGRIGATWSRDRQNLCRSPYKLEEVRYARDRALGGDHRV